MGWLIVYFPAFQKKYIVCIPPIIFAINILEACIRDFQLTGVNGIVDGYMVVGGPWNVMNGIAGILNAICIFWQPAPSRRSSSSAEPTHSTASARLP